MVRAWTWQILAWLSRPALNWLFFCIGIALSIGAWLMAEQQLQREAAVRFETRALELRNALENHLHANSEAVRGLQSHFASSDHDDRRQFRRFFQTLQVSQRYPGIQALTFSRRVSASEAAAFIAQVRADQSLSADGFPDFTIKEGGNRTEHFVVDMLEPLPSDLRAHGFDLGSEPERRAMVERARDSGQLTASGKLQLFLHQPGVSGFILAAPVYRPDRPLNTLTQRRAAFLGVATGVFRLDSTFHSLFGTGLSPELALRLDDLGPNGRAAPTLFYQSNTPDSPKTDTGLQRQFALKFGDRHWRLTMQAKRGYGSALNQLFPLAVLAGGLAVTLAVWLTLRQLQQTAVETARKLSVSEQRLSDIVSTLDEVIWSMDIPERRLNYISPAAENLYGWPPMAFYDNPALWMDIVAEEDHPLLHAACRRLLKQGEISIDFRIARRDGSVRWIHDEARLIYDANGVAIRIDGITRDITDSRQRELQLRKLSSIVEQSPAAVVITDPQGRIEYVNPKFCEVTGYTLAELIGQSPSIISSGLTPREVYATLWQTISAGQIWQGELLNRAKDGTLFWEMEVISPIFDSEGRISNFVAIKENISDKKKAEAALQRSNRMLRILSSCNAALVHAENEQQLLDQLCKQIAELGNYPLVWVGFPESGSHQPIKPVACFGTATDQLCELIQNMSWGEGPWGMGPSGRAIREQRIIIAQQLSELQHLPWHDVLEAAGVRSVIGLPLQAGGNILGVLCLYAAEEKAFDSGEVGLLQELAADLAYGLIALRRAIEQKVTESALRLQQRVVEASSNGVMICDAQDAQLPLVYVNPAFERITGYQAMEVLGRNASFLHANNPEQAELAELQRALAERREARFELHNCRKDGSLFWNELSIAPVLDEQGQVGHILGIINDISERKRYEAELEHQATHDALTGLANRLLLADRLSQAIAIARRAHGTVAVLLLDLDRFKLINDSLGHQSGDALLCEIASRLRACVREGDTVARLGGDEFVLAAPLGEDEHGAFKLAQTVLSALAKPIMIEGTPIYASGSLGLALYPRDGDNGTVLLRNADAAMYRAKSQGGSQIQFYAGEINSRLRRRLELENALRTALHGEQFEVYFQPKASLHDGSLTSAEALIRWRHPELGMVSPGEFIPIAEETGIILEIGDWVLNEVCRLHAQWRSEGIALPPLAVNLSARQFNLPELRQHIAACLARHAVDPAMIELELTESALIQQPDLAARVLTELKALGCKLSLDDFGTGYSSLNYLRRFPIDQLKIDQSFVRELSQDGGSAAIARTIIRLAHSLQLNVVAEGVETPAQLAFLQRNHCDEVQGYLFGRPMPAGAFRQLLQSDAPLLTLPATPNARSVLLLSPHTATHNLLLQALAHQPYQLHWASSAGEALELLALKSIQVLVTDLNTHTADGAAILRGISQGYPDLQCLLLSDAALHEGKEQRPAVSHKTDHYSVLPQPFTESDLLSRIKAALYRYAHAGSMPNH